jgi:hypothetical protein
MAPPSRFPAAQSINPFALGVAQGVDASSALAAIVPEVTLIRNFADLIATPALNVTLPRSIKDERGTAQTIVLRSDATQVTTQALQLRGGVFCNYSTVTLYLQIHGVTPAPAANVQPAFPPIPVTPGQTLFLDQVLLGVDGFGYNAATIRVSTTVIGYTPTATTAGLWAGIFRFKGAA